jgi:hypothetical protein
MSAGQGPEMEKPIEKINSFPHYDVNDKINHNVQTQRAMYHTTDIEIKSNHPMANAYNYALKIVTPSGFTEEKSQTELDELSEVSNPSPVAKGKDHTKDKEHYEPNHRI